MTTDSPEEALPKDEPITRLLSPLKRFLHVQAAGGIVLLVAALTALAFANSSAADAYLAFWKTKVGFSFGSFHMVHSLQHWINDGLMVIFFFVMGLEVKRELVLGELQQLRKALLPIAAAFGGMVVPAGLFLLMQQGQPGQSGWGIPMATDIAFVVGCMALLGPRIPPSLRILLLSLAIVDDLGAILVIAVGYTDTIHTTALVLGFVGMGVILLFARLGVRSLLVYSILGILVWFAFHESGVHATIAGVLIGLMTPARSYLSRSYFGQLLDKAGRLFHGESWDAVSHRAGRVQELQHLARETVSPLEYLEHALHPWVSFFIMPVFALANAGVAIQLDQLGSPIALAILVGLLVGKPVGVFASSWLAVKVGLTELPPRVTWMRILGAGFLAGIGFTMALFIAGLALQGALLNSAKLGILVASMLSGIVGMLLLMSSNDSPSPEVGETPTS